MIIEYMDVTMYCPSVLNADNEGHEVMKQPNELDFELLTNDCTIFIDPSSTCTGIIICDNMSKSPVFIANLYRSKRCGVEQDGDSLIDDVITFLRYTMSKHTNQIKFGIVERPFDSTSENSKKFNPYSHKKGMNFYQNALLVSAFNRMHSLCKNEGILTISNSAPAWEHRIYELFPQYSPDEYVRAQIKKANQAFATAQCPIFNAFKKKDCCDCFGMGWRFYTDTYPYLKEGIIPVQKDMIREFNYKMYNRVYKFVSFEDCDSWLDCRIVAAQTGRFKNLDAKAYRFIYNEALSIDDNIKALQYLKPMNVFWTVVPVNKKMLSYITNFREEIGELTPNDKLFILGSVQN